jgi:hypothetical protein
MADDGGDATRRRGVPDRLIRSLNGAAASLADGYAASLGNH